jgi:AcrR family transcriptional regulator
MRRLATELGVDPMAIYHHLPGKAAVVAGLIERVFEELHVPLGESEPWQERVRAFARAYHGLARAHPKLVLHLVSGAEGMSQAVLAANEILYAALAAAGLAPARIVRAADLIVDYLNGFVLGESTGQAGQADARGAFFSRIEEHPQEQFPTLRLVLESVTEDEIRADVEAGLDIILAGIEAIARMEPPSRQAG